MAEDGPPAAVAAAPQAATVAVRRRPAQRGPARRGRLTPGAARLPQLLALLSGGVALVTALGYLLPAAAVAQVQLLLRPSAALGLLANSVCLALMQPSRAGRPRRRLAAALAGVMMALGAASLAVMAAVAHGIPVAWEPFFARPVGAAMMVAMGACGAIIARHPGPRATRAEVVIVPLCAGVALLMATAHLFDAPGIYGLRAQQRMMPLSSYCFLLHAAALTLIRSRGHALAPLLVVGLGAQMGRRLLLFGPPAIAALGALALTLVTRWGLHVAEGMTLLVVAWLLLFVAYACWEAGQFNALDASRARALRALRARGAQRDHLIGDLRRIEADLHASLHARDTFVSIASHELRSPLGGLAMQAGMFARQAAHGPTVPSESAQHFVEGVRQAVRRLDRLVDDMLDVARAESGQLAVADDVVDVAAALRESYSRLAPDLERAGMAVDCEVEGPALCRGDAQRLEQVFTNLLSNAVRYAPHAPLRLRVRRVGPRVVAEVRDHGPGIPAAAQARVFGRYQRVTAGRQTPGGLGLGLYIGRQIVQAHGGTLTLDSQPGAGARFEVALPAAATPPPAPA